MFERNNLRFPDIAHTLRQLATGQYLFHRHDPIRYLYEVVEGGIVLRRVYADGRSVVLQQAKAEDLIAEASLFSDCYHCDAVAQTASVLRVYDRQRILETLSLSPETAMPLLQEFAGQIRTLRQRAEILSLKTVSERLDAWILANNASLPAKGQWKSLAEEIGTSPEALYREISKRRRQADLT